MWNPGIKYLPHLIVGLAFVGGVSYVGYRLHSSGVDSGRAEIQAKWDKETFDYNEEVRRIQAEYAEKEALHRRNNTRITHELAEANRTHAVEIATMQSDFDRRLQLSSNRSAIYQRQAEAGAAECRGLASHASRLDASLEEGRALVRELRATLGLRDQQVKALSDQIRNDRSLLEE